jgi:hypothetical protein
MDVVRRIGLLIVAAGLVAAGLVAAGQSVAVAAPTASAHDRKGPVVTPLAEVGSDDFVIGSTIGPDRALYVTDGVAGAVLSHRPPLWTRDHVRRRAATEGVPG